MRQKEEIFPFVSYPIRIEKRKEKEEELVGILRGANTKKSRPRSHTWGRDATSVLGGG
jgi:hypothetical protein